MEALRTKVDGLQWELHRLEAENLRLREANPEASESLDQLDRTKSEAAELADGVQELERKLEESTGDASETRRAQSAGAGIAGGRNAESVRGGPRQGSSRARGTSGEV